ncbi:MAG: tyrosine-type recombinase/integrase [Acidimicrobiales bacterium]
MSDSAQPALSGTFEVLVEDYRRWLVTERCLAPATVAYVLKEARRFLADCDGDLRSLTLGEVISFVVQHCSDRSVGAAKRLTYGLRSLLAYLFVEGHIERQLAPAVPTPSGWHGSNLPRWIGAAELAALVAGGEDRGTVRRRDHAIVVTLARLGLRPKEIAGLSLDDLDWERGEIVVRGKADRSERLPLPVDVGEALVDYLREERAHGACRTMFLRVSEPVGLSTAGVGKVVRQACVRAGVSPVGVYRLRHSAATAMLRAGGSLEEVGQVLRHRSTQITAMYAKVNFVALRPLALPWPTGGVA